MEPSPNIQVSDNEDCDSFYSFPSEGECVSAKSSPSSNFASSTDLESEHETSGTSEKPQPGAAKRSRSKVSFGFRKPKSIVRKRENSSDSSAGLGVSTQKPKKPLPRDPKEVPELASNQMQGGEPIHLDSPQLRLKDYLTADRQTEAMQKYAFTEIWVNLQQKPTEPKRSPQREFSTALDGYFNSDLANNQANPIGQPIIEPATTMVDPDESVQSSEEYVSPFEEASQLEEPQMPIIVPAGLDS